MRVKINSEKLQKEKKNCISRDREKNMIFLRTFRNFTIDDKSKESSASYCVRKWNVNKWTMWTIAKRQNDCSADRRTCSTRQQNTRDSRLEIKKKNTKAKWIKNYWPSTKCNRSFLPHFFAHELFMNEEEKKKTSHCRFDQKRWTRANELPIECSFSINTMRVNRARPFEIQLMQLIVGIDETFFCFASSFTRKKELRNSFARDGR